MKRVLLSILIGLVLVSFYLGVVTVVYVYSSNPAAVLPYVQLPVRLPQIVFYYFFPPAAEDYAQVMTTKNVLMGLSFFLVNVLLYSIPVYFLLSLAAGFGKPKSPPHDAPPSF
jgi:hypothetical protein